MRPQNGDILLIAMYALFALCMVYVWIYGG